MWLRGNTNGLKSSWLQKEGLNRSNMANLSA